MKYDESWFSMPLEVFSHFHLLLFGGDFYIFLPPAKEVWDKVIFLPLSVILFTGGVYPIAFWDTPPPPGQTPPGNKWVVHILLECILVSILF